MEKKLGQHVVHFLESYNTVKTNNDPMVKYIIHSFMGNAFYIDLESCLINS